MINHSLVWLAGASLAGGAQAAAIPISSPGTIDTPGHYVLATDLQGSGDLSAAIIIDPSAGEIHLDLDGHAVHAQHGYLAIWVIGTGLATIRNGALDSSTTCLSTWGDVSARL